jgi:hypothetical protein
MITMVVLLLPKKKPYFWTLSVYDVVAKMGGEPVKTCSTDQKTV